MENIRAQEKRNSRIAYDHQNQRMAKAQDDDRKRRDAHKKQMYDRLAFLRRSCRCRFICLGLSLVLVRGTLIYFFLIGSREACEELMFLEDQLQKWLRSKLQIAINCLQIISDSNFQLICFFFLCYLVVMNKCLQMKLIAPSKFHFQLNDRVLLLQGSLF